MANDKNPGIKVVKDDKLTVDDRITIKELEEKIDKMIEDREAKCKAAKEQLIEMLQVTADKYRTATGAAEALRILRFIYGNEDIDMAIVLELAQEMVEETSNMADRAKELDYEDMDKLCDGFYEKDFSSHDPFDLAFEMMRIDLCRNVGGAAEDMVGFINRVNEEIEDTEKALAELKAKED